MPKMISVITGDEEDNDILKDSEYMNHFDQLGSTKDIYGDTNKRHKISNTKMATSLEAVLKRFLNTPSVMGDPDCSDLLKVLFFRMMIPIQFASITLCRS